MAGRPRSTEHHLLVIRVDDRFTWQIRQTRFVKPVSVSSEEFSTEQEAESSGRQALQDLKRRLSMDSAKTSPEGRVR